MIYLVWGFVKEIVYSGRITVFIGEYISEGVDLCIDYLDVT